MTNDPLNRLYARFDRRQLSIGLIASALLIAIAVAGSATVAAGPSVASDSASPALATGSCLDDASDQICASWNRALRSSSQSAALPTSIATESCLDDPRDQVCASWNRALRDSVETGPDLTASAFEPESVYSKNRMQP